MFDDVIRELKRLEQGVSITISMPVDDNGYLDRRCPWDECGFVFKVVGDDWKDKVPDEAAFCSFCGHKNSPAEFNTPEQTEYIQHVGTAYVQGALQRGLRSSSTRFNSRPQRGLITIRFDLRSTPIPVAVPPVAEDAMTLRITCEQCSCRFAVIGTAYFCPACGYNSAGQTFDQSMDVARRTVGVLPTLRSASPDRDTAAQVTAKLVEGTLGSLVTAFQRFAEAEYPKLPNPLQQPRRNAFQNLQEGSGLWSSAGGTAYALILDPQELAYLQRLFQQRHLLAHREGLVDQDYIAKSGDTAYTIGQRLVVREDSLLRLADLLDKLTKGLRADL